MDTQEVYAARIEAQMRATDARLDELEAQARARNAQAEMDEISGLRARRDQFRQQLASARKTAHDDWEAFRRRVDTNWNDLRRDVAERHSRFIAWDDARERKFVARIDEAEAALRKSAAVAREVAADVRLEIGEAQQELRDRIAAARESYDAWRSRQKAEKLQRKLDDAELELDEASNRHTAALGDVRQHRSGSKPEP